MIGKRVQTLLCVNLIAGRVIFYPSNSTAETGGEICLGIETECPSRRTGSSVRMHLPPEPHHSSHIFAMGISPNAEIML
jgi:hypothetical protein